MQISYKWLTEYLPEEIPIEKLSEILTGIGLEVESVEKFEAVKGSLEGLTTGKVLTCIPHPNADKLKLTTVDIGSGDSLPIVCGAPNVAAGQKVIVATVGTKVHPVNGVAFEIKKAKIRGEVSEGMICAEDEIGLGESHDGIMVLPGDTPIGIAAKQLFNIPEADYTIHIGLTPNRSDAMSHIGVARDVCAYLVHHEKFPLQQLLEDREKFKNNEVNINLQVAEMPVDIDVQDTSNCPRYCGIVLTDIKIGSSPEWMQQQLKAIGLRPINNIVDITNFVLHEYGQPLHAFDYDKIAGKKIIVKPASQDEKFITLDSKEIKLRSEDLMICDAEKSMCIGGVYGGQHSGVTDATTTVFLESAFFNPRSIRRTSMHHQLRTDAATHFEKTVDMDYVVPALKRAVQLICEIGGGHVASHLYDLYPEPIVLDEVQVRYEYIHRLCGKNYSHSDMENILQALGFIMKEKGNETFTVIVPANKADVKLPADIAEEILRIDGLNKVAIPEKLNITLQNNKEPKEREWKSLLAESLIGKGFQEIITNSITNSKYYPGDENLVKMINSLSNELDVMRPSMLESGLEVIAYNANRKQQDLLLFENGDIYSQKSVGDYSQEARLAIWASGNMEIPGWQSKSKTADIYFLKGIIEYLFERCGLKKHKETITNDVIEWKYGKDSLVQLFEVPAAKVKTFDIRQQVFYAELNMRNLVKALENNTVKYAELPKFPAMKRDLSLVLDKAVTYDKVSSVLKKQPLESLKSFELFDVFENEKLGADKKSLALSFTFQRYDRTLTDAEVDAVMQQIMETYKKELQAEVRM